jgi:non-ribosomal peptide synthase protein (TIGR01720 family)
LEDLQKGCQQVMRGEPVRLPNKTTSFQQWAIRLKEYGESEEIKQEESYWQALMEQGSKRLPVDYEDGENTVGSQRAVTVGLDEEETRTLLQVVPEKYQTQINDALLMALSQALAGGNGLDSVIVDLEGHGREDLFEEMDITRTVGWFTTLFPVELSGKVEDPGEALKLVKKRLQEIPKRGIGYGVLRYFTEQGKNLKGRATEVMFNYLGQFDQVLPEQGWFGAARESSGAAQSERMRRDHLLQINGRVEGGRLYVSWGYSERVHRRETVERWASEFLKSLRGLIEYCRSEEGRYLPADFPLTQLSQEELDRLISKIDDAGLQP